MNAGQVIKILQKDGWYKASQRGSHIKFKHPEKKGRVIVPVHGKKDLKTGTLKSISDQSGIAFSEFK
jgi:predicted RNA binding protein YcfA (HicA-like mRNA interferase family)